MKSSVVAAGVAISLLAIGGGGFWLGKKQAEPADAFTVKVQSPGTGTAKASAAGIGIPVEATRVKARRMAQGITAVGSLRSDESVTIRPEVAGRVSEILFQEGQRVVKGKALIRLDAAVQRAELQQAEANLALSKSRVDRAIDLHQKGFISAQARDEADSNYKVAQAAYDLSRARLTKLDLTAPFSGIVGLRQVSIGDYIKDGQDVVNLEGIDPLKVDFKVPEIYLKQVATGQSLQIVLDAFPNQTFSGRILAINPLVDTNGRSIVIRALVKNSDARLRPGMFARIRLLFSDDRDSLTVPEQAMIPVGDDQYVYKVVDGRAQRVKVDIGQRREGQVEVLHGLKVDELVVTAGQLKLRDGMQVKIANANAEKNLEAIEIPPLMPPDKGKKS